MKTIKKLSEKIIGLVLVFFLAFSFCASNISAANVGWTLKCDPKLHPNYNKIRCEESGITTKTTTTIHVNNVGGGAELYLYSSNILSHPFFFVF